MKKNIESYNSTVGLTSRQFIIPSGAQILLYLLISVLLLISFNLGTLWRYLNNVILAPQGGLDSIITQRSQGLHRFLSAASQSIVLQVLFWICVGCVVYIFIWFVRNMVINILNDVVADKYVHPTSYNRVRYWQSVIARKVFFGVSVVLLIAYLIVGLRLMALLGKLCYFAVTKFYWSTSLLQLATALLATAALIYLLILLLHLVVNSWRFIYKDL